MTLNLRGDSTYRFRVQLWGTDMPLPMVPWWEKIHWIYWHPQQSPPLYQSQIWNASGTGELPGHDSVLGTIGPKSEKKISTKVYFKPTDCHALLHKSSYHPKHTFKGIIKSQIIRFYRISSKESDLQDSISVLFRSLRKRLTLVGFSEQLKVAHLQDSILT